MEIVVVCSLRLLWKSCYEPVCTPFFVDTCFLSLVEAELLSYMVSVCLTSQGPAKLFQSGSCSHQQSPRVPFVTPLPVLGVVGHLDVSRLVRHEWSLTEAHRCPLLHPLWDHSSGPYAAPHLPWPSLCFSHTQSSSPGIFILSEFP